MASFSSLLDQYPRIGIAGGSRAGKTTLSEGARHRRPIVGTDSYRDLDWAEVPHRVIADVSNMKTFIVEGVQVGRALRKGLAVDALVYLDEPFVELSPGQAAMNKGVLTILRDWASKAEGELPPVFVRRGDEFEAISARELFGQ